MNGSFKSIAVNQRLEAVAHFFGCQLRSDDNSSQASELGELVIEQVFTTEELLIRSLFATKQ
jgi:hypothetical protein